MPLLLLDLDNTLIDRAAAFERWATDFVAAKGAPLTDVEWLVSADRDGLAPREQLAEHVRLRYGLSANSSDLVAEIRNGLVESIDVDPSVLQALDDAVRAGWTPVIVTNGSAQQQERKIRRTGLDTHVAGWVVSGAVGVKKPDAEIFRLAASSVGVELDGAWMIGDSAEADVAGAHAVGIDSVWLHRGRTWPALDGIVPPHTSDNCVSAIALVRNSH